MLLLPSDGVWLHELIRVSAERVRILQVSDEGNWGMEMWMRISGTRLPYAVGVF